MAPSPLCISTSTVSTERISWIDVFSGWASGRLSGWTTTRPIFIGPLDRSWSAILRRKPMPFPSGLRALNHADYRRFFAAQLGALVSGWMHTVAQSWLVLQLTDSPFRLGLIGTLQFGPILVLSVVTGAFADR